MDRRVRRLLAAIVLVAGFAELAYVIVNISAMPVYIRALQLDPRWIGAVGTAYLVVEGLLKSPFGVLGDRIGRKALIVTGPAISTFTALITPFVHNPYALVGLRVLDGIGAAALWPSAFSLIGDLVPEGHRGRAMSLFNIAYILGIAVGPAIGGGMNDWAENYLKVPHHVAKEASFYVASFLFGLTAAVAFLVLPHARPAGSGAGGGGHAMEGGFSFGDFRRMIGRMPMILLMAFVTFLAVGLIMLYTKVFALDFFDLSESEFGVLLIIPALAIAAASIPLGTVGDRIGKSRTVKIGIGLCTVGFWALLAYPEKWSLVVMGSVIGVGFVMAFPAWMALVTSDCDAGQRGAAVGAVGTAQGIGAIIGAAASGFLYKIGDFSIGPIVVPEHGAPFLACGFMLAITFVLALTTVHEPSVAAGQSVQSPGPD